MKKCILCKNEFNSDKYARCNKCRIKNKRKKNDNKLCTGCHCELPSQWIYGTCKKCHIRGGVNRDKIKSMSNICKKIIKNTGYRCQNTVIKYKEYCEEHIMEIMENIDKIKNKIRDNESDEFDYYKDELKNEELDKMKLELQCDISKISNFSIKKITKIKKKYEQEHFKPKYKRSYYINKIYNNYDNEALDEMDLFIEFIPDKYVLKDGVRVKNKKIKKSEKKQISDMHDLWTYFRIFTSNISGNKNVGRHMRFFLKDRKTNKYLGIVSIGSDILDIRHRDESIGWCVNKTQQKRDEELKKKIDEKKKIKKEEKKKFKNMNDDEKNEIIEKKRELRKDKKEKSVKIKVVKRINKNNKINDKYSYIIDKKLKNKKMIYVGNITCCVGLQPVAYNYNIGKLLASLCFSKEVQNEYEKRYGNKLACITTFSLYGKGIQYSRLKNMKFCGYTQGNGCHIPDEIFKKGMRYLELKGIDMSKIKKMSSMKMRQTQKLLNELDIDKSFLNHGLKRGIYVGFTGSDSKNFLCYKKDTFDDNLVKSCDIIIEDWKNNIAKKRYKNLVKKNRLKTNIYLVNTIRKLQLCDAVRKYEEKQKKKIGDDEYKKMKSIKSQLYEIHSRFTKKDSEIYDFDFSKYGDIDINHDYLGGLFDGDGSIYIYKNNLGYSLNVIFSQTKVKIMEILQIRFGGNIYKSNRKRERTESVIKQNDKIKGKYHKTEYGYRITGNNCKLILDYLEKGCIRKYENVLIAKEFLYLIDKTNDDVKKEELYNRMTRLNRYNDSKIKKYANMNLDYIIGLFDAEGCVYLYENKTKTRITGFKLDISQGGDIELLKSIQKFLGFGTISGHKWTITNSKYLDFIMNIEKKSIIKKKQLQCVIKYIQHKKENKEHTDDTVLFHNFLKHTIHKDKHSSVDIEKDKLVNKNKIIKKIIEKNKEDEKNAIKIIKDIDNSFKEQKSKNIGKNNGNYGEKRSDETNYKSALSIMTTSIIKNNLTDEKIVEIRRLGINKEKGTQKKIVDKYNISRHVVLKIWRNEIVPSYEFTFDFYVDRREKRKKIEEDRNNKTSDEINKNMISKMKQTKRKLTFDEIINFLKIYNDDKKNGIKRGRLGAFTDYSKYISELYNKKISHNILKSIFYGKTKLDKLEFQDKNITYDEYLDLLKKN